MITQSFKIGKVVFDLCKDICSGGCFAVIADKGAEYPFMVYRRAGIYQDSDKDTNFVDNIAVEIMVAATNYDESVELIQKVKDKLELKRCIKDDIKIINTEVTGCSETWTNDSYVQHISLTFKVSK